MILLLKDFVAKLQQVVSDFFSLFSSLIKVLVLSRFHVSIPKPEKKEAIVIGNGPSLKKMLVDTPAFFENKDLICVNNFPASAEFESLKPNTLVWLDNAYYPTESATLRADIKDMIEVLIEKTSWKFTILVPQMSMHSKHIQDIAKRNSHISIHYFNYTIVKGFDWFSYFFYKRGIGMPLCQNVVVASIFLAVRIHYKSIYLTGVENSFFKDVWVNEENEVYLQHAHFYDKNNDGGKTKVHIRPGSSVKADLAAVLMMAVKTFTGYKAIKKYADHVGVHVYNVTEGSYVDAFERKKITDLL